MIFPSTTDPALPTDATGRRPASYWRLHGILSLISLMIVLVSINRKSSVTSSFVAANQFLRWTEMNNMILGLSTVVLYFHLSSHLVVTSGREQARARKALGAIFVIGTYVYGLSFGNHEVTNYLHGRFCASTPSRLCDIIAFNDDNFSDFLFLAGFSVLNVVVMATQVRFPSHRLLSVWDNVLIAINALFVSAGIVANLAFEKAVFDPYVVAMVAVLALALLIRSPRQPILRYYTVAYAFGLIITVVIKSQ
ncbi:hypothetical protein [Streptomyces sp. NPDC026673]|uniref:hypothetical protein n=1 Tax=Streptomyces sp. NPDC026673 TaxID=3155724 RepID=UPI0033F9AD76